MKNWKIVYTNITGTIMCIEFETFEEMENWLTQWAEQLKSYCKKATVWELFEGEWKIRHSWKRA
jgi:hypothetical protein